MVTVSVATCEQSALPADFPSAPVANSSPTAQVFRSCSLHFTWLLVIFKWGLVPIPSGPSQGPSGWGGCHPDGSFLCPRLQVWSLGPLLIAGCSLPTSPSRAQGAMASLGYCPSAEPRTPAFQRAKPQPPHLSSIPLCHVWCQWTWCSSHLTCA